MIAAPTYSIYDAYGLVVGGFQLDGWRTDVPYRLWSLYQAGRITLPPSRRWTARVHRSDGLVCRVEFVVGTFGPFCLAYQSEYLKVVEVDVSEDPAGWTPAREQE